MQLIRTSLFTAPKLILGVFAASGRLVRVMDADLELLRADNEVLRARVANLERTIDRQQATIERLTAALDEAPRATAGLSSSAMCRWTGHSRIVRKPHR
ncbi:MAG: hypothetical protein DCC68_07720 [Planctomycetota bacterium]|nr:MAG: hypothetical protein DCC68_07720 [Planctomycetota bacterium]